MNLSKTEHSTILAIAYAKWKERKRKIWNIVKEDLELNKLTREAAAEFGARKRDADWLADLLPVMEEMMELNNMKMSPKFVAWVKEKQEKKP